MTPPKFWKNSLKGSFHRLMKCNKLPSESVCASTIWLNCRAMLQSVFRDSNDPNSSISNVMLTFLTNRFVFSFFGLVDLEHLHRVWRQRYFIWKKSKECVKRSKKFDVCARFDQIMDPQKFLTCNFCKIVIIFAFPCFWQFSSLLHRLNFDTLEF